MGRRDKVGGNVGEERRGKGEGKIRSGENEKQ